MNNLNSVYNNTIANKVAWVFLFPGKALVNSLGNFFKV